MKQLLVLTNFTTNSAHAAITALGLCEKINTSLLLYHSVQYVPVIPDYSYGSYVTETADILFEESKKKLTEQVASLQSLADKNLGFHPQVTSQSGEGTLADNIKAISDQPDISLVVMGGRSGGAFDHLLTGSETNAVIKNSRKPVLVIPEKTNMTNLKKVVFATDFNAADFIAIKYLLELSQPLGFVIEVVHVIKPGYRVSGIKNEIAFRAYLDGLDQQKVSYKHLFGDHKVQRLQDYCEETGASVLAMTRIQHDWISRLFDHSETIEVTAHQRVAVMIFPPAFTGGQSSAL